MDCKNYYVYEPEKNFRFINIIKDQVNLVSNSNEAEGIICFGGDGTILDVFQKYPNKSILPIRNYDRCEKHKKIDITNIKTNYQDIIICEKTSLFTNEIKKYIGLSELIIRNKDISKAMRCLLKINDKIYAKDIIGDGIICCTKLGSTGYFKSITNTIFTSGIGIGFINNTQGMTNLIIDRKSIIEIEILRGDCQYSIDHLVDEIKEGEKITFKFNWNLCASLLNYKDIFMCTDCRNKRHSAYVNTIYSVI